MTLWCREEGLKEAGDKAERSFETEEQGPEVIETNV
jgi:hypothetical protein